MPDRRGAGMRAVTIMENPVAEPAFTFACIKSPSVFQTFYTKIILCIRIMCYNITKYSVSIYTNIIQKEVALWQIFMQIWART